MQLLSCRVRLGTEHEPTLIVQEWDFVLEAHLEQVLQIKHVVTDHGAHFFSLEYELIEVAIFVQEFLDQREDFATCYAILCQVVFECLILVLTRLGRPLL